MLETESSLSTNSFGTNDAAPYHNPKNRSPFETDIDSQDEKNPGIIGIKESPNLGTVNETFENEITNLSIPQIVSLEKKTR